MAIQNSKNTFGKLVKLRVLTEVFVYNKPQDAEVDFDEWWKRVAKLSRHSKSYKKDTIVGTYGKSLDEMFCSLSVDDYVAQITSIVVFTGGKYVHLSTKQAIDQYESKRRRVRIMAFGVKIFTDREATLPWRETGSVVWLYRPNQIVDLEIVDRYNSVKPGDMLEFKRSEHGAMVVRSNLVNRRKFYGSTSWTRKSVVVLSCNTGKTYKLPPDKWFQLSSLPSKSNDESPSTSSSERSASLSANTSTNAIAS